MTPPMRLSTVISLGPHPRQALERAVELEAAGVDILGVVEAYGTDSISLLGFLAARTERAELIAQILPIYSRTPTLIAMTAAGLDEVSDGRFMLGLGASGPQVVEGWHGVRYDAPLGRTREIIEICRSVWRRDRLVHSGRHYSVPLPEDVGTGMGKPLKLIAYPSRPKIPIYLAALGERMVELAASRAEGWIPFIFVPERADAVWGESLRRGQAMRDRGLGRLQISAGGPFAITDRPAELRQLGRAKLALYLGGMGAPSANFYNEIAHRYGFVAAAELIQMRYLSGDRAGAEAAVPDELLEGTSLIGDIGYLRDRLKAYAAAGVTVLQVDPIGSDPVGELRRLRKLIDSI